MHHVVQYDQQRLHDWQDYFSLKYMLLCTGHHSKLKCAIHGKMATQSFIFFLPSLHHDSTNKYLDNCSLNYSSFSGWAEKTSPCPIVIISKAFIDWKHSSFNCRWILFLDLLMIIQPWLRYWLYARQATSHDAKQLRPRSLAHVKRLRTYFSTPFS